MQGLTTKHSKIEQLSADTTVAKFCELFMILVYEEVYLFDDRWFDPKNAPYFVVAIN
jgi:hypothetical protein